MRRRLYELDDEDGAGAETGLTILQETGVDTGLYPSQQGDAGGVARRGLVTETSIDDRYRPPPTRPTRQGGGITIAAEAPSTPMGHGVVRKPTLRLLPPERPLQGTSANDRSQLEVIALLGGGGNVPVRSLEEPSWGWNGEIGGEGALHHLKVTGLPSHSDPNVTSWTPGFYHNPDTSGGNKVASSDA
jgi:hypothetical protein